MGCSLGGVLDGVRWGEEVSGWRDGWVKESGCGRLEEWVGWMGDAYRDP